MATHDIIYGNHVQGGQGSVWTYDVKIYINLHSRFLKLWAITSHCFPSPTVCQLLQPKSCNSKQLSKTMGIRNTKCCNFLRLFKLLPHLLGPFSVSYLGSGLLPPGGTVREPKPQIRWLLRGATRQSIPTHPAGWFLLKQPMFCKHMCQCQIGSFPLGVKIKKIFELPPPSFFEGEANQNPFETKIGKPWRDFSSEEVKRMRFF